MHFGCSSCESCMGKIKTQTVGALAGAGGAQALGLTLQAHGEVASGTATRGPSSPSGSDTLRPTESRG